MGLRQEKRCSKCGFIKPIEQFSKQRQRNGREGRRSHCKDCIKIADTSYIRSNSEKIKVKRSAYRLANYEKVRALEVERERRKASKPGYSERKAEYERARQVQNPEYAKTAWLKRNYNLTRQEYWEMHQAQDGLCAICGNPQISGRELSVDHDHKTGI